MEVYFWFSIAIISLLVFMLASEIRHNGHVNRQVQEQADFYYELALAYREKLLAIQRFYESRKEYDAEVDDD